MIEESQPNYGLATPPVVPAKKPRKPRAPKKETGFAKPITRAQGAAFGALGLTLGNALVLAFAKWLGVH